MAAILAAPSRHGHARTSSRPGCGRRGAGTSACQPPDRLAGVERLLSIATHGLVTAGRRRGLSFTAVAIAAVRPASPDDIPEIARIQRDTWRLAYAELLPPTVLAALDGDEPEQAWEHARAHGPARLFVATEGGWTVGFCAAGFAPPAETSGADGGEPDDADTVALVGTLLVEPRWGRRGHGGRLLATAAASLRTDGATRGIAWIPEADDASRAFYARVGWQPDGTVRTLDADGTPLREIRVSGPVDLTLRSRPVRG